jgi:hypothetical protein
MHTVAHRENDKVDLALQTWRARALQAILVAALLYE